MKGKNLGNQYVWIKVIDKIEVGINPNDLDDYKCNCNDPRHLYYIKYKNWKCKAYKIALEKLNREVRRRK